MKVFAWIGTVVFWLVVAGEMYVITVDCIPGSDEYPCPTVAERNAEWLHIAAAGLAVYVLAFTLIRWLYKKRKRSISN